MTPLDLFLYVLAGGGALAVLTGAGFLVFLLGLYLLDRWTR